MKSVVVVGAGAVGLWSALQLVKRGAKVIVLEAEREDFGGHGPAASLAAAGMLAPATEALRVGASHPGLAALMVESFKLWRTLQKGALWADGVRFDGGAFLAAGEAKAANAHAALHSLGAISEPMSSGLWRKRVGLLNQAPHALWIEDEATLDPERALSGLAMDARRHGVQILFGHDVEVVKPSAVRVWDGPTLEADHVVLAPGAWGRESWNVPALKALRPAKGHLAPVKIEGGRLRANIHAEGFYLARRADDDVVLGSTMQFDDVSRHVEPARLQGLFAAADEALPGVVRAEGAAWAGVRPMSPDWAPMIGWSNDVLVACGHSRNGWLLAPITAEIVCAYVLGDAISPLWATFSPQRFETSNT